MESHLHTLSKSERISKRSLVEQLFSSGSKSFSMFPLRVVYRVVEKTEVPVSILVSVPKKNLRQAVNRNRVKRQVREAYRKNKELLSSVVREKDYSIALAFIWLDKGLHPSSVVTHRVCSALMRIAESVS